MPSKNTTELQGAPHPQKLQLPTTTSCTAAEAFLDHHARKEELVPGDLALSGEKLRTWIHSFLSDKKAFQKGKIKHLQKKHVFLFKTFFLALPFSGFLFPP